MIPTPLSDLDELVLGVRDGNSRVYVGEAVHAYRNGLGRAAVILTWTALAYDLTAKYRELADHGEAAAARFVAELDSAIAAQNIARLQQIENELLSLARNPFELIDDREYAVLERLKEDRNHCAHPAFTGDNLLFSPLPELVRAHIVQSIKSVLQHAPLQGKAAFDRLKTDLLQASFPIQQDQVTAFLQGRYLTRLKPSLIGRVITILTKELILQPDQDLAKVPENLARSLVAASQVCPSEYEQVIKSHISKFASSADDEKLQRVFLILGSDVRVWDWLDKAVQIRLETLLTNEVHLGGGQMVRHAFNVPALAAIVKEKYEALDDEKKKKFISRCPVAFGVDDAIGFFHESGSFRTAEVRGQNLILRVARLMTAEQIRRTLGAVLGNGQIWDAGEIPETMKRFYDLTKEHLGTTRGDWQSFLDEIDKKRVSEYWTAIQGDLLK